MAKHTDPLSINEIQQLPLDLTMTVPPQWEDRNGHVNVQHYLGIYNLGGWKILENIGIDEAYLASRQYGIFDLEHHIRYLTELQIGEVISVYSRILSRDNKRIHGMMFIVNDTRLRLACTLEYLSIGIDQQIRHAANFPTDMELKLDELLEQHNSLNWDAPVCGNFNI